MEDRLSLARVLNKTLHWVSDKGVGEHVRDVEEVLGDDVGGAPEVKVRQLICLSTMFEKVNICSLPSGTCQISPSGTSQRRTRRPGRGTRSRGL